MNLIPPLPPFNEETARQKVQAAEDAWNSRDPERDSIVYTEDTRWRNDRAKACFHAEPFLWETRLRGQVLNYRSFPNINGSMAHQ